ncbi:hypothetical protein [Chryseobacterium taihuense]|uniref:Uncharacterized protein n=1 Tax=Chryseobacterium taihuense TaxID=1141221 RepID=A0ABY0R1T2_9FLAO|nr:hypothetical protein [Chryseobacterium taihuense]SDM27364.1 hypothetical protein SAMN05216273_11967 [Chryseobacterium taihuense]
MKNLVLFILILFSKLFFAQASATANFSLKIDFEENIPVDQLEIFYNVKAGNTLKSVEVKIDKANNSVSINGINHFIIPINFPTLSFSYTDKTNLDGYSDQIIERKHIFYLVTGPGITSYSNNNGQNIRFSKELSNVLITSEYKDKNKLYRIQYFTPDNNIYNYFNGNLEISNSVLKLN